MNRSWYTIYTTSAFECPYCKIALDLLRVYNTDFIVKDINIDAGAREEFLAAGHTKVPQCYREDVLIGGSDKLKEHLRMTLVGAQNEAEIERKTKF
ncbi:glutaredoxin protein [Rhizobium phage RHph_I3_11]|nr:glutaredoxin protein [Rhizobium phage RHph_I3_11]